MLAIDQIELDAFLRGEVSFRLADLGEFGVVDSGGLFERVGFSLCRNPYDLPKGEPSWSSRRVWSAAGLAQDWERARRVTEDSGFALLVDVLLVFPCAK